MQREASFVGKLLSADFAEIFLFAGMCRLMVDQVRFGFKTGVAGFTNVWPIVRVYKLVTLQ